MNIAIDIDVKERNTIHKRVEQSIQCPHQQATATLRAMKFQKLGTQNCAAAAAPWRIIYLWCVLFNDVDDGEAELHRSAQPDRWAQPNLHILLVMHSMFTIQQGDINT